MDLDRYWPFQQLSWRIQRIGWAGGFLILCAAAFGLLGGSARSQRLFHGTGVDISYGNPLRLGVPAEFIVSAASSELCAGCDPARAMLPTGILIGTGFVDRVDGLSFLPEPKASRLTSRGLALDYPEGVRVVRIRFAPERSGFLDLALEYGSYQGTLRSYVLP